MGHDHGSWAYCGDRGEGSATPRRKGALMDKTGYYVEMRCYETDGRTYGEYVYHAVESRPGVVRVYTTETGAVRAARALMRKRTDRYAQPARVRRSSDRTLLCEVYIDGRGGL